MFTNLFQTSEDLLQNTQVEEKEMVRKKRLRKRRPLSFLFLLLVLLTQCLKGTCEALWNLSENTGCVADDTDNVEGLVCVVLFLYG